MSHHRRRAAGFVSGLSTVTFQGSATSFATATTLTIPSGVQAGDLGLLYVSDDNISGYAAPSGWTLIDELDNTTSNATYLAYKILESGDASASLTTSTVAPDNGAHVFTYYRGNIAISTVTPYDNTVFYSTWSSQTVSAAGQTTPLIVYGGTTGRNDADPSWTTESPAFGSTVDADSGADNGSVLWGVTIYNVGDTPSDHTVFAATGGSRPSFCSGVLLLT